MARRDRSAARTALARRRQCDAGVRCGTSASPAARRVPHAKGLSDIARLVAAGGDESHVLDLVGVADRSSATGTIVDCAALDAYRRLADTDLAEADRQNDPERRAVAAGERQALLDELRRVTGTRHKPRQFAKHPAERAGKAVSGRIRDAIRKLEPVLPELAAHLQRTIITGTYCRYRPDTTIWELDGNT